uniref:Uncharacterized protein n=1 Tax=Romanomermis culicivorax TaxID=13658 RepID=A0A915JY62_ROMCU
MKVKGLSDRQIFVNLKKKGKTKAGQEKKKVEKAIAQPAKSVTSSQTGGQGVMVGVTNQVSLATVLVLGKPPESFRNNNNIYSIHRVLGELVEDRERVPNQ